MGGGGVWWILDFREDVKWGTEKGLWRGVRPNGEMKEKWGKCDLKSRSRKAQLEYVRTHMIAFDRTRAWRKWCNKLCGRTHRVSSNASVQWCVRVLGVLRSNLPR
jgi:hypothetical protein